VFVGLADYTTLPKPLDLAGSFLDGSAMLSWNFKLLSSTYGSYQIERSIDGVTFEKINKRPYSVLNENALDRKGGRIFYVDSVSNDTKYTYRVRGINAFGELGPPSEEISGEGKKVLEYVPKIVRKEIENSNTVKIDWEFPIEGNSQIIKFELNHAEKEAGPYKVIVDDIKPETRSLQYDGLGASNYFTLTAVGKQNNRRTSYAVLVQPIDSIPPAVPTGLKGTIDSLGIVKFSWDANQESDILGYRVHIANEKHHEFSTVNSEPQYENYFTDTVSVKDLNSNVYYKVSALDKRYNTSKLSVMLEIQKPDLIPPTSPVFNHYKLTDEGTVALTWKSSSSRDVENYLIYRKRNDEQQWRLVFEGEASQNSFTDEEIEEGYLYNYTILARDRSFLESLPAPAVSVKVTRLGIRPKVRGFYAEANKQRKSVMLSWRYKETSVAEFEIYRAVADEPFRLLRTVPNQVKRIEDADMTINTQYKYMIRAIFKDGNVSGTDETKVKY